MGAHSYRTTSRAKVPGATGFMAQTRYPQQCALRAGRTGWPHSLGGISHAGLLQWKVCMLGKAAVCQEKEITEHFLLFST